ncbi:hypothetical protein [Mucilaginibacter glaciei]|uniref:DUF4249 family protein n=1 Tax=Mucilaginibacter glaciei TaxID=2772109 RepID=A0A926RZZ1_9SPHI|nr:hypothetical protein [Mucilaginibacter glaciei]MBD1392365.1 hypothetical protein [Mucilaginibacter glaciei]
MKLKLPITFLFLATLSTACIKSYSPTVESYDVARKIFRVKAQYQSEPYNIVITQLKANSANSPYSVITGVQKANFDYDFTPAAGDTIKIKATSKTGSFVVNARYLDKDLGFINLKQDKANNNYSAEFAYVVPQPQP